MLHRLGVLTLAAAPGRIFRRRHYAQGTATLRGEVNDNYGSAIPAAKVTATNNATGVEVTVPRRMPSAATH